jgi:hypothetical protein
VSDVRRLGPLGSGGESQQPVTVDLTRIDIRRGTLNLPRRFYGALPEGDLPANDTVTGAAYGVYFRPPRQLEGLGPFFEEHDLRPNDAVVLAMSDGLQVTPMRRERRQGTLEGADGQDRRYVAPAIAGVVSKESAETEVSRGAEKIGAKGTYVPPAPAKVGGWQDVLHDPVPRARQGGRNALDPETGSPGSSSGKLPPLAEEPIDAGGGEGWHMAPRDLSRPGMESSRQEGVVRERRREEGGAQGSRKAGPPLAPAGGSAAGPSAQAADRTTGSNAGRAADPKSGAAAPPKAGPAAEREAGPAAGSPSRAEADRKQEGLFDESRRAGETAVPRAGQGQPRVEREPVAVGASGSGEVTGRISRYLEDPGTPAIVRASAVAETLRLPLETVQRGLAEVARNSDGAVTSIRSDVYLVKRGR